MKYNKYLLVVLSILILLVFVSSASAADVNETDVLSVDESDNIVNEKLALDYKSDMSVSNDSNILENDNNEKLALNPSSDIYAISNNDDILSYVEKYTFPDTIEQDRSAKFIFSVVMGEPHGLQKDLGPGKATIKIGDYKKTENFKHSAGTIEIKYDGPKGIYDGEFKFDSDSDHHVTHNFKITVQGPSWYVNSSKESSGNGKSPDEAFVTLEEAIEEASDYETIKIASGEYKGEGNSGFNFMKNLNFIKYGDGEAIFEGNEEDMPIWIFDGSSINITGLTFKNGKASNGALFICVTIEDSNINATFINNTAKQGGAIYFGNSGVVSCNIDGTFINNTATTYGGAIYMGYDFTYDGSISGTFINNKAEYDGGAIYVEHSDVLSKLSGTFRNNKAGNDGGAIYVKKINVLDNLSGTFRNNKAGNDGGAIYILEGSISDINAEFINNAANSSAAIYINEETQDLLIHDSIFMNNTIIIKQGNATVINSWFENNATNYNTKPGVKNVTMDNWLFLNATTNATQININETSEITFKLYSYNSTTKKINEYDASKMNIPLALSETCGKLSQNTALINETIFYTCTEEGIASVTAKFETASCTIILAKAPSEIIVNKTNITLKVGESVLPEATLIPAEAGNLTYTSSKPSIATVENGMIKGLKEGKTTITVSFNGSDYYNPAENKTIEVTVNLNNASVSVNNSTLDLKPNDTFNLVATTSPKGLRVNFTSSNESIVTVNDKGEVIAVGLGSATITASVGGDGEYAFNSTTVDVSVKKDLNLTGFVFGMGNTITIIVMDFENATGNATITVKTTTYTTSIKNSRAIVSMPKMSENTTAYIYYPGDDKYNNASTTVDIHAKQSLNIIATADPITVGENANVIVTGLENASGNVSVTIDDNVYYGPIKNSTATIIIPGLKNNITTDVYYDGDDTYYATFTTIDIIVYRNNLNITATADPITVGDNATVKVTGLEDATGEIKVVIDGNEWIGEISKGTAEVIITGLKETVTAEVLYPGDEKYNNASTTVDISVKRDLNLSGFVFGVGDTIYIFVMDFENATGNVTITVNANNYTTSIRNSMAIVSMPKVSENTTAYIYYPGDNKYNNASTTVDIHVREGLNITATADPITVGENATVKIMGLENATGNVTVTINNNTYYSPIKKGTATVIIPGLKNNLTATVNYAGDDNYYATFTTFDIVVYRNNLKITATADPITVGDNATVKVTDLEDATGEIKVVIDGNEWIGEISKGTAEVIITGLKETVTAEVLYPGDEKYNNASTTVDIVVNPAPAPEKKNLTISASADPITVGENATVKVTGLENATGHVSVIVKGKIYAAPIKNGEATITVPGLTKNVIAIVNYKGDDIYNPALTIINITVYPNIINIDAPDVTKYFNGPERFAVNVTDSRGNPLSNKTVFITINGRTYNRTTDENGTASIALGLHSGQYNVTTKVENITAHSTVTILTTVDGSDIVKIYKNATQYYATFIDTNGKYLADGTDVKFNINGIQYTRKITGGKGQAKLNINLPQGKYIITATNPVTGEMQSNNITVLPTIVDNKDITKYYRNATQYSVKILGSNGKAVGAGENVTFNVNGIFYTRQTNPSGIATLNINLPPSNYVITADYKGCKVANNIKVLPVLNATDLKMKYKDGSQFKANLVDGQGKAYAGQTIQFNINGVLYNKITGNTGQAALNINLPSGEYIITSSYNGSNIANKITIS